MKKLTSILVLSASLAVTIGTVAGIVSTQNKKSGILDATIEEKYSIGGEKLSKFKKSLSAEGKNPLLSKTFVQVLEEDNHSYLRFAVAVDVHRVETMEMTRAVEGKENKTVNISTVYKGLKTETGGLYYNSTTGELTSDVSLWDENYYLGSYSIELESSGSKDLKVSCSSEVVTVESTTEESKPTVTTFESMTKDEQFKVTYIDLDDEVIREDIVGKGETAENIEIDEQCGKWFNGDNRFDFNTPVNNDLSLKVQISHDYNQEIKNQDTLKTAATCENDAVYYKSCVCGAVSDSETFVDEGSATGHEPADTWSKDDTYHWHACAHDETEQLDKAEHSYSGEWQKDDATNHKKVCECGYKIVEAHDWDDGQITTQPTHTTEGVKTFTCEVCGETKTESIPVDTSIDHYNAVMPAADKRGMREYWDDGLGNSNSISFVAPGEGTVITEKTLAEDDFNSIISNEKDERVIYSLNELNTAVATFGNGNYPNLRAQKVLADYQYLDATTKAAVTNYSNFEAGLKVLEAIGISGLLDVDEVKDLFDSKVTKSVIADSTYGEVAKLTGPESGDGCWTYAKPDISKFPSEGFIKFAVKSTTPVDMMLHNSAWDKCINLADGSVVNCKGVAPSKITLGNAWKEISIPCENLKELGSMGLALYCTSNGVGYGINAENPAYITEIYYSSDFDSHFANPGSIVEGPKEWGTMKAEVGSEIDDTYGYLTTFKVLTTGQVLQYKFNNTLVGNYHYVSVNIYCPVEKSDLFIQSTDWSGGVIYPAGDFNSNIIQNNIGYLKLGWNEVKIPGAAFKNATWFAIVDTKASPIAPVDSVYKMSLFRGGNFSQSEIDAAVNLIDTLPAAESLTPYDYYKIKDVENRISTIASINSSLISNYDTFTAVKAAYDAKYYLICDPATVFASIGSGGNDGTSATFGVSSDETYGSLLQINVTHVSDKYFQLYFYTNWGNTRDANDKIHVAAKSPQKTTGGTSQSFWYGDNNNDRVDLLKDTFVELSGTMTKLTDKEVKAETTTITQSFNLQWYNGGTGDYTAVYYMTAIFGEIVD